MVSTDIEKSFDIAERKYAEFNVNVKDVLKKLSDVSISMHCWQGDDVGGFEHPNAELSGGGIQVTGNYPGKARSVQELRQDYLQAFSLIPGNHRINIHAIYGEFGGKIIDRDNISIEHFQGWIDWARSNDLKIDFNPTLFSHPKASDGFTLSNKSAEIRDFWIDHVIRCRDIAEGIGRALDDPCINNLWIPDGSKDIPVDRAGHRNLLMDSLDKIYEKKLNPVYLKDSVEGKLFGVGSESFVVGSHEFYLSYALSRGLLLTLDCGHFHPTESVADKISAILPFNKEILLHVSRGVRWDSDHVVIVDDNLISLCEEIVRSGTMGNIHLALDFFDASINRIGAWVIGMRSTLKGLLYALLQPWDMLLEYEENGQNFQRLALLEELKTLPYGAIWDHYCLENDVPVGPSWIQNVEKYEQDVLNSRK
ncbi:MAG: L-rhamnose isomerase [Candidatus Hodarchaeota archaeon]